MINSENFNHPSKHLAGILITLLCVFGPVQKQAIAQMFSVESNDTRTHIPLNNGAIGIGLVDFNYIGSDTAENSGVFEFDSPTIVLTYETRGLDLYMEFANALTGLENQNYYNIGGKIHRAFQMIRKKRFGVSIPVHLHTDFTRVITEGFRGNIDQFQQSAIMLGTGLMIDVRPFSNIRLHTNGHAGYGYSLSAGSAFFGKALNIRAQQRVFIDNVFGELGLSFGYDFNFKQYNVENDYYDYNLQSHNFVVGLTF